MPKFFQRILAGACLEKGCSCMPNISAKSHTYTLIVLLAAITSPVLSAGTPVSININTQTSTPVVPGFSGFNMPQPRNGVEYYDPKFINTVTPLKPGWLRFPGGTLSMAYDWNPADPSGGHINIDWMNSLILGNPPLVTGQSATVLTTSQQMTQAKGGVYLFDFAAFARYFGSKAIICINGYTDTPQSAGLLAQAAQNSGLNVVEWELATEPYVYTSIFPTAASYGIAMHPYFKDIKSAAPSATTAVFFEGQFSGASNPTPNWDQQMQAFFPQYWNAVSTHVYPITKILSPSDTIETLNGVLAHGTAEYINSYMVPLVGAKTPIFITEFNCCTASGNKFLSFLYNGIFLAEYTARMSAVPNVKAVGMNSLYTDNADYHGLIQSVDDYESYLLAQVAANPNFYTNTAIDPSTPFQFYTSAPGVALGVANYAINDSTATWPTTVTGGPLVPILGYDGQPIPAVYAQGYKATTGRHHLLITNKSSATCSTTIQLNGTQVSGTLTVVAVSNTSGLVANTAQAPNTVQLTTTTSANPISVGPYSVTFVTW
jgi:hypothetical protein